MLFPIKWILIKGILFIKEPCYIIKSTVSLKQTGYL